MRLNPNSGFGGNENDPLLRAIVENQRTAPPRRTATVTPLSTPAKAPATNYSIGKGTQADDAWWDKLAFDKTGYDKASSTPAWSGTDPLEGTVDLTSRLAGLSAIGSNFGNPTEVNKLTGSHGSIGRQGGLEPVPGKPGHFTMQRQPVGNKSYNLVSAEYKISADGKSLERIGDWKPIKEDSTTQSGQLAAKLAAAGIGAGVVGGALLGGGQLGAGATAGATAEGVAAPGIFADGMGIGQIGASELTPALAESAVGTSGYGLSSAGAGGIPGLGGVAAGSEFVGPPDLAPTADPGIGPPAPGSTPPTTVTEPPVTGPPNTGTKPPVPGTDSGGGLGDLIKSVLGNLSASKGGGSNFRPTTAQQLQLAQSLRQPDNNITMINPNSSR